MPTSDKSLVRDFRLLYRYATRVSDGSNGSREKTSGRTVTAMVVPECSVSWCCQRHRCLAGFVLAVAELLTARAQPAKRSPPRQFGTLATAATLIEQSRTVPTLAPTSAQRLRSRRAGHRWRE